MMPSAARPPVQGCDPDNCTYPDCICSGGKPVHWHETRRRRHRDTVGHLQVALLLTGLAFVLAIVRWLFF